MLLFFYFLTIAFAEIDWDTCTYGDWVDILDDYAVKVDPPGFGERLTNDDMENDLYYEYATIDDCKSRCDSYSDDYDERCNGINYVTSNQRCFLYAKARELESTELANRQSTYRPCTNPPQCANWCSYKGINGWCKNCNFDKCQDCTECNEPNLCTIRSTECRPWCHTHPGVHYRCSFEKCEGCNFCPQICPEWCDRDDPNCDFTACQNCEQCRAM